MLYTYFQQLGPYFSWIGLFCGLFFFMYSVRYYVVSILVLMKDQKALAEHMAEESSRTNLGFIITAVNMNKHLSEKFKKIFQSKKVLGFKTTRVKNEEMLSHVTQTEAGFVTQKVNMATSQKYQELLARLRNIYWQISQEKNKIVVYPARLGIRKRLHTMMMLIIMKSNYHDLRRSVLNYWFEFKQYLSGNKSFTVDKKKALIQTNNLNKFANFPAFYLGFKKTVIGQTKKMAVLAKRKASLVNLNSIEIIDDPALQPFISIHLAFYNEENVAERCIEACLAQDYEQYEIVIADDSNDRTAEILARYAHHPKIKIVRRDNREGFKGGALKEAIKATNPRAKFINVYDADFVPPPNTLKNFMKEFFTQNGNSFDLSGEDKNLAAVQGYQWHVLNKDENFVTAGIRFGFAGGYMVERVAQQYFGAMKMIAGSVFVIRRDVMEQYGWQMPDGYTSIVEDWNLTIRMYIDGWKIGYTPDIKVPAECVNSLSRLSKQQIRWAEGHTWNVKKYFFQVLSSAKMTLIEKLEFLHYGPFYLQSAFFILGTFGWIVGELIFHAKVPGWTATLGWSLVFTNLMALPVMCISGIVLERGENRDYNILPFLTFIYYIIPSLAYASVRGLVSTHESGWVRTKKTGSITDGIIEGHMASKNQKLIDKNIEIFQEGLEKAAAQYQKAHPMFKAKTSVTEDLAKGRLWMELKRVPRLGLMIILIMSITLGSLGYIASTEKTLASPDVLYLNSPQYLSYYTANSPTEIAIGPNNNSYSWYSDLCPIGDDPGGVAAGNYSAYLVLNQKPTVDKNYSLSVGHVNESGGDYQAITSTGLTINQSTSNLLSINLGNGPEIVCNKENKRKMVFTISYVGAPSGCDLNCDGDDGECSGEECSTCDKSGDDCDLSDISDEKEQIITNDIAEESTTISDSKPKKIKQSNLSDELIFNRSGFSPFIETAHATVIPCGEEVCNYTDDMNFYTALSATASGTYPTKGTTADQVTLSRSNPTSSGYLDLNLDFDYIDSELTDPSISINFSDLDLHGDTVTSGSNTATLFETFTLYDTSGNQLAYLDSSYGSDDNFTWSTPIDKDLIIDNTLHLRARMTATVTLTTGSSITLQNTIEGMSDISICGIYDCSVPETIELTTSDDCDGINLSWTKFTDEYISGYKLLRSTTDPDLTYPEDGYYQYLSGQNTINYQDTNVVDGQGYYYRIGAYLNGQILSYSDTEYIVAHTDCYNQTITPILDCVDDNDNGIYTAHFGYDNPNSATVNIPIGNKNKFIPDPKNRGQMTSFLPGNFSDEFQVVFNGLNLKWVIKSPNGQSRSVIAKKTSPSCSSCMPTIEVEFNCDMHSVYVESDKELSNVVLELEDGTHQKFDDLSGYSGTFSPTGSNEGKLITGIWVKSGCNSSGDGPGYGEYFPNPYYPEGCPIEPCCDDDLVIEFNNATSTLSTPCIIVPEFTLLFGAPLVGYLYLRKKQNEAKNKNKK